MSNYTKATNFATKDTLPTGDAGKIVKGTEIDNELNAIASAISSKADTASPTFTGTPLAPTASAGTNTTQLATTAFVKTAVDTATGSLGTLSTQNSNSVSITGGSISGITDLAIADGGTGASTAVDAFTNLKQAATDTTTGVVELATVAEVQTGTDTARAITPAGFNGAALGWGQSWTDVTASRAKATTYTNSTGRPIMVTVSTTASGGSSPYTASGFVGAIKVCEHSTGFDEASFSFIVPNGSTYKVEAPNTAVSITIWAELR